MSALDFATYYANLLIIQYIGKAKAYATIRDAYATPAIMPTTSTQTIAFDYPPVGGAFVISWNSINVASINWNDSAATIQGKIRAVSGLGAAVVTGSIASQLLTIALPGLAPIAQVFVLVSSTLTAGIPTDPLITEGGDSIVTESGEEIDADTTTVDVDITIADVTGILPLDVQNAFNLTGPNPAVGVQLDTLGKYAGVQRTGQGFTQTITLDDADFLTLITMAIIQNNSGSSLATIQNFLQQFFAGEIFIFDTKNMHLTYFISESIGPQDLIQLFITEGLLPRPMGVALTIIYAPGPYLTTFFGFRTYDQAAVNATPFNTYSSYRTDWHWLSYAYGVSP